MEESKEKKEKKLEEESKSSEAEQPSEKTSSEMSESQEDVSEPIEKNSDDSKEVSEEVSDAKEKNSEPEVAIVEEEKQSEHKHKHEHKHHEAHKHHEHKHEEHKSHAHHKKEASGANVAWPIISAVLAVLLIVALVFLFTGNPFAGISSGNALNEEQIKVKAQEFINTNLLQPGTSATITNVELKNGLYDLTLEVNGQSFPSQMTADGEVFFVQPGIVIDEFETPAPAEAQTAPPTPDVPKADKPVVEMFVMSHCPYGTQIEKGMLPVVDLLGAKADIQVKFVNYAMHGKKEVDEQVNQYCIQQEYTDSYYAYLQCFLKEGDTAACLKEMKFDQAVLDKCIAATDKEFGITADFDDKASWSGGQFPKFAIYDAKNVEYGVRGSPTLVINGQQVSVGRDSNSLKNVICNAFSEAPEECGTDLPSASPSPGFGFGTSATDSAAANCGV